MPNRGRTRALRRTPESILRRLERLRMEFGGRRGSEKRALITALASVRFSRAGQVRRLHEVLCYLRAYPDDPALLALVEKRLGSFARRPDLKRHRASLEGSGIAGTAIRFRFFAPAALWLARRWPDRLTIDWDRFERADRLEPWIPLMAHYAESPGIDEYDFTVREWIDWLRGPHTTDGAFLVHRLLGERSSSMLREKLYDQLDPPLHLAPSPDTPSRTRAKLAGRAAAFQRAPLVRSRPDLRAAIAIPPRSVRRLAGARAREVIDLGREAMVTRERDLDVFSYANPRDIHLVDAGGAIEFACIGMLPERRLLLEAVYGFLTLRGGVPIGYVLCGTLFGSAEIAYNVFETFRGAEAASVYARFLAVVRHLFRADTFTIDPYQIGRDNREAIASGAWWFYQKLGFRPRARGARRLMERELSRMARNARHLSSASTLERLAEENLYWYADRARDDVMGRLALPEVGLRATRFLARRFGADRDAASRLCSGDAMRRVGLGSLRTFSPGERLAWERWAPLVLMLPGLDSWSGADKRALIAVVRAKGGPRESDFVALFDRHTRLRRAIRAMARETPSPRTS